MASERYGRRRRSIAACALALTGCVGSGQPVSGGLDPDGASQDGGTQLQVGEGQDATAMSVTVSPPAPSLCAGECVDLTATATGGTAPFTYAWSQGLASGPGPDRVCPTRTTTYTVLATDSSGARGELPRPPEQASASVTVTVGSSCADAATPEDAAGDVAAPAPPPATGLASQCGASWPSTSSNVSANAAVALDASGDIFVAASFTGSIVIGGRTLTALGSSDAMLVKLDPQCHLLWANRFGASQWNVDTTAVAVDSSSSVVLVGSFGAPTSPSPLGVDFGTGVQSPSGTATFVAKLDPSGKTTWVNVYQGSSTVSPYVLPQDVAADPSGNVLVVVHSEEPLDFGSGVLANADANISKDRYLVKLGPDGSLLFAKTSETFAASSWLVDSVDTTQNGSIWLGGTGWFDTSVGGTDGSSTLHAVHLDTNGTVIASQSLAPPTALPWVGAAVRVGPADDAVVSAAWTSDTTGVDWIRWFEGLSSLAAVRWTYPALAFSGSAWDPAEVMRVDSAGDAWSAGDFAGSLALGAPVGTLTTSATAGLDVVALGAAGTPVSGSVIAPLADSVVGDMALDASGHVVVAGWITGSGSSASLFVTKLGF